MWYRLSVILPRCKLVQEACDSFHMLTKAAVLSLQALCLLNLGAEFTSWQPVRWTGAGTSICTGLSVILGSAHAFVCAKTSSISYVRMHIFDLVTSVNGRVRLAQESCCQADDDRSSGTHASALSLQGLLGARVAFESSCPLRSPRSNVPSSSTGSRDAAVAVVCERTKSF